MKVLQALAFTEVAIYHSLSRAYNKCMNKYKQCSL